MVDLSAGKADKTIENWFRASLQSGYTRRSESKRIGLDIFREAAMIATIAGHDNVVVNRLAIEGKGAREIVFMREGAIQDPQRVVNRILADPGSGWQR